MADKSETKNGTPASEPVIATTEPVTTEPGPSADGQKAEQPATTSTDSKPAPSEGKKRSLDDASNEGQEKKQRTEEKSEEKGVPAEASAASAPGADLAQQAVPASLQQQISQDQIEIRVLMKAKWMGGVIGKGGSVIREYRQGSGAYINISNNVPGCDERVATVKGAPQCVMYGLQMVVTNLVTQMVTSATYYPQNQDEKDAEGPYITFLVPNASIGLFIGKAGATIKQVRDATGASIKISDDCMPNSTDKSVTFRGSAQQIWGAAEMMCNSITMANGWNVQNTNFAPAPSQEGYAKQQQHQQQMYAGGQQAYTGTYGGYGYPPTEPPTQVVLPVPTFLVGSIIGKGGKNISDIRGRSGANVKIADAKVGAHERMVTITGTRAQNELALAMIYDKMNQQTGAQHSSTSYMPQQQPAQQAADPTQAAQAQAQMAQQYAAYGAAYQQQQQQQPQGNGANPYAGYPQY